MQITNTEPFIRYLPLKNRFPYDKLSCDQEWSVLFFCLIGLITDFLLSLSINEEVLRIGWPWRGYGQVIGLGLYNSCVVICPPALRRREGLMFGPCFLFVNLF